MQVPSIPGDVRFRNRTRGVQQPEPETILLNVKCYRTLIARLTWEHCQQQSKDSQFLVHLKGVFSKCRNGTHYFLSAQQYRGILYHLPIALQNPILPKHSHEI